MSKRRVLPDVDLANDDVRDSQGRRITEGYARAATAQAIASVGPDRPSLTGARATSPQVTFRVTREALERYLAS